MRFFLLSIIPASFSHIKSHKFMTETVIMRMMMMTMTMMMMMMMMTTEAINRFVCAVVQPTSYLVHHLHNDDRENHLHIISNKDDAVAVMTTNRMMWRMMTKRGGVLCVLCARRVVHLSQGCFGPRPAHVALLPALGSTLSTIDGN